MSEIKDFKNIPNGGFPNIYKLESTSSDKLSKRRKESINLAPKIVNVREILMKKRHADPYLPASIS